MLPWSSADSSGVAPPAPGLSSGSDFLPLYRGRPVEQPRDRGADELDVADLLGADALEQVAVGLGLRSTEVDALEQVLHHRPHLAELTAEPLLQGVGGGRVRLVGLDVVDQSLHVQVHGISFGQPSVFVVSVGARATARRARPSRTSSSCLACFFSLARVSRGGSWMVFSASMPPCSCAPALDLGVELRAEQQRQVGDPQPEQEHDDAGQRAVGLVVAARSSRRRTRTRATRATQTTSATIAPTLIQRNFGCRTFGVA